MPVADTFQALIVCTANECRSVFTTDTLAELPATRCWKFASRGTAPEPGTGVCIDLVAIKPHASAQLDAAAISKADLVLVMEREHRSRVAELVPAARSRVFLLREAARLAGFVQEVLASGSETESGFATSKPRGFASMGRSGQLRWLVAEMHEARTYIDAPADEDVRDAHGENAASHQEVRRQIEEASAQLAAAIERLVG